MSGIAFAGWYIVRAGTKGKRRAYWVAGDGTHARPSDVERDTDAAVHASMRARYECAPWTEERAVMVRDGERERGIRTR